MAIWKRWVLLTFLALFAACQPSPDATNSPTAPSITPVPGSQITPMPPEVELDALQRTAEVIAINSDDLQRASIEPLSGEPLRLEIFGVYPARESDLAAENDSCVEGSCYRVDAYNYALNTSYSLIVNLDTETAVSFNSLSNVQPEIPPHLAEKAVRIANDDPQVAEALGIDPAAETPTMPNVKTALNNTACERSRHLCVAPTFIIDDRALWVIVDLTEEEVVGVRWTDLGASAGVALTEETILFEELYDNYCAERQPLSRDGWEMSYVLTSSDGLEITTVTFNNEPVLDSAKLIDWHVSYSRDGFGYSDGIGCPVFSSASVVANRPPEIIDLTDESGQVIGFALWQDYTHPLWPMPCNYRYQQQYEFYTDGRFRIVGTNLGRGCGTDGTYRPIFRLQWPSTVNYTFEEWQGESWQSWEVEQWQLQSDQTAYTPEGYQYRLRQENGRGYAIEPGQGQFPDGLSGDSAYLYLTRYRAEEGEADMLTLGSCCNTDYQQGPETFINAENTLAAPLVTWYVPQLDNDDTPGQETCWADSIVEDGMFTAEVWPCAAGPLFVPLGE